LGCFLNKGREREKKESGDSSENGICSCGLPACLCQPAVAGGVIYADLWGELNTLLAPQALFTQSSPVHEPQLQAFPFPSTLGEVTLHPLSQAFVFIYSSCGKWVFPSPMEFSSLRHSHKLSRSWLLCACCCFCLLFSSQAWIPLPPLRRSGCSTLFALCLCCSYCSLLSFSFFPGWRLVCPGGYADLAQGCL
jgi:hypothetical protein